MREEVRQRADWRASAYQAVFIFCLSIVFVHVPAMLFDAMGSDRTDDLWLFTGLLSVGIAATSFPISLGSHPRYNVGWKTAWLVVLLFVIIVAVAWWGESGIPVGKTVVTALLLPGAAGLATVILSIAGVYIVPDLRGVIRTFRGAGGAWFREELELLLSRTGTAMAEGRHPLAGHFKSTWRWSEYGRDEIPMRWEEQILRASILSDLPGGSFCDDEYFVYGTGEILITSRRLWIRPHKKADSLEVSLDDSFRCVTLDQVRKLTASDDGTGISVYLLNEDPLHTTQSDHENALRPEALDRAIDSLKDEQIPPTTAEVCPIFERTDEETVSLIGAWMLHPVNLEISPDLEMYPELGHIRPIVASYFANEAYRTVENSAVDLGSGNRFVNGAFLMGGDHPAPNESTRRTYEYFMNDNSGVIICVREPLGTH